MIAIELVVMAEGLEYQRPLRSGTGVEAMYAQVRAAVAPLTADRSPAPDIARVDAMIRGGPTPTDRRPA